MNYAILGTGALGGYYGACLQRAGLEVHFLLHSDYRHVREHGLRVDSVNGDFTLPRVHAYQRAGDMPACDMAIVALKTTQNYLLSQMLPAVLKPDGAALILQNGLGVENRVAEILGPERVMGGLCFLCSNKIGPGHIRHLDYGRIRMADYADGYRPAGITPRLERVAGDFRRAGIEILLAEDLLLARWEKLVWNIPFNGLSVVLNASTEQMIHDPTIRDLAVALMQEVTAGAAAQQRRISPEFVQKMLDNTARMKPYHTSMKLDYDAGHSLEIEAIFGEPLAAARRAGVNLPRIDMLYRQLKFLDPGREERRLL